MSESARGIRTITRSNRQPPAIHAVPLGSAPNREHRPSGLCWCQPVATSRDIATMAPVWTHYDRAPARVRRVTA